MSTKSKMHPGLQAILRRIKFEFNLRRAMTDSLMNSEGIKSTASSQTGLHAISAWLDAPPPLNTTDDLLPLLSHLATLRASQVTPEQRASVLERLYTRSISVLTTLLPALSSVALRSPSHVKPGN